MSSIEEKQRIEIEFWRDSPDESPQADSIDNLANKFSEAQVFLDCLGRYEDTLCKQGRVLELGSGQGWAACIYKKQYPQSQLTVTDISEHAIASVSKWERLLEVKIDACYACKSYEIREDDASIEQVFCFAAAHHFLAHGKTLREIARVLRPGGRAIYFYEPTSPKLLYAPAYWRVNRKRPQVPEDVLITSRLRELAAKAGLGFEVDYYPCLLNRGPVETIYYFALGRIPCLQRLLPCTANLVFTKLPARSSP
jgi:SAM-dependent methyltransferase